jgi:hypothetical protein
MERSEPKRKKDLILTAEPKFATSKTEMLSEILPKDLRENADPKEVKSTTLAKTPPLRQY